MTGDPEGAAEVYEHGKRTILKVFLEGINEAQSGQSSKPIPPTTMLR